MTEKASPEWFTCPGLEEGGRVAIQLGDGTLAEGYWYDGAVHDEPREPEAELPDQAHNPHYWPFRERFSEPSPSPYTLASVFSDPLRRTIRLDPPFWPNRPPAPWRIRKSDGLWHIEKRLTNGWETHRYCATGPDAFTTFSTSGAR